jgi:hypothetical protein
VFDIGATVQVVGLTVKESSRLNGKTGIVVSLVVLCNTDAKGVRQYGVRMDENGSIGQFVGRNLRRYVPADDLPEGNGTDGGSSEEWNASRPSDGRTASEVGDGKRGTGRGGPYKGAVAAAAVVGGVGTVGGAVVEGVEAMGESCLDVEAVEAAVGALGEIIADVPLVGVIGGVAKTVVTMVVNARYNKLAAALLSRRVREVTVALAEALPVAQAAGKISKTKGGGKGSSISPALEMELRTIKALFTQVC